MANQEHLDILAHGIETWNAWRRSHSEVVPNLFETHLSGMDLSGVDLSGVPLFKVSLIDAKLNGANLKETSFLISNLRSVDLSGANLVKAKFYKTDLNRVVLNGAELDEAELNEVDFTQANLSGANFSRASLTAANFSWANLSRTDLSRAFLSRVNFSRTDLSRANLSGASIGYTTFADVDLSEVRGLKTVRHDGPSTIGIDTIYKSGGKIPAAFLRGCGVPDSFIEYIPSLVGALEPIQYHSCFISYSTKDEDFARRLHERMRAEHLRVWFAPEDIKGGDKLYDQIDRAIQLHDRLLLVLSEQSMSSEWVMTEIRRARRQEITEQRRKLFPIRLVDFAALRDWSCFDADHGKDLAVEVREYFIPDFSAWKQHDAFEAAFARLLRDLRAAESP